MNKKILIAGYGDVGKVILKIEKEAGNKCEKRGWKQMRNP